MIKTYDIRVSVDTDKVTYIADCDDVIEAIKQEAGWMEESGICVKDVKEVK